MDRKSILLFKLKERERRTVRRSASLDALRRDWCSPRGTDSTEELLRGGGEMKKTHGKRQEKSIKVLKRVIGEETPETR